MTMSPINQSVFDLAELHRLTQSGKNSPKNLRAAAAEFESMLYRQLLKSMRSVNALFGEDNPFSSQRTRFYEGMWDDQMAAVMARTQGAGLADIIARQLSPNTEHSDSGTQVQQARSVTIEEPAAGVIPQNAVIQSAEHLDGATKLHSSEIPNSPERFVQWLMPVAKRFAAQSGLPVIGLIAQAALETGWGRYVLRDTSQRPSFNVFNIKADHRWSGPYVTKDTLEFDGARMVKVPARFRAYERIEQAFQDLIEFFKSSPRYARVWSVSEPEQYFEALQQAGYATDPNYAEKLKAVLRHPALSKLAKNLHKN